MNERTNEWLRIVTLSQTNCCKDTLSVLTAISRWTWASRCLLKQRMMEVVVTTVTGAINRAKLQSNYKGDIHRSKTANIILPGLVTENRWTPLGPTCSKSYWSSNAWSMDAGNWNNSCHRVWILPYFACTRKGVQLFSVLTFIFAVLLQYHFRH